MSRKYNKNEPLKSIVSFRLSDELYKKLEDQRKNTDCQSLGEFARRILERKPVIWYHKDATMDNVAAELSGIKRELRAIGTNINQVTRYFNSSALPNQKIFEALKILDDYQKVNTKVKEVMTLISEFKW
jgi:hypothetical protein